MKRSDRFALRPRRRPVLAIVLAAMITVCGSLFAAGAGFCADSPDSKAAGAEEDNHLLAIDFTLKDLSGKPMKLADLRGHPVIVDFWATWCAPCRKLIPELESIYHGYRTQGLIVVGVACDTIRSDGGDGTAAVGPFVKEMNIDYPILIGDDAVTDKLAINVIPTTLFLDRQGMVIARFRGSRAGELTAAAKALIGD